MANTESFYSSMRPVTESETELMRAHYREAQKERIIDWQPPYTFIEKAIKDRRMYAIYYAERLEPAASVCLDFDSHPLPRQVWFDIYGDTADQHILHYTLPEQPDPVLLASTSVLSISRLASTRKYPGAGAVLLDEAERYAHVVYNSDVAVLNYGDKNHFLKEYYGRKGYRDAGKVVYLSTRTQRKGGPMEVNTRRCIKYLTQKSARPS